MSAHIFEIGLEHIRLSVAILVIGCVAVSLAFILKPQPLPDTSDLAYDRKDKIAGRAVICGGR
jgi:transcriptional regulator of met regulon